MHRRTFITLVGSAAAAWPNLAIAQPATLPVIGFVNNGSPNAFGSLFADFRRGIGEAGFVEGQSVNIEARWAEGSDDRLPALVSELVQRRVSLIVATGGSASVVTARALAPATPIVFVMGADPIKLGIVNSLNKPGANITGISLLSNGLLAKQAAILHETIAKDAPIGFLVRPANPNASGDTRELAGALEGLGHKLIVAEANTRAEIAPAVMNLVQKGAAAMIVFPAVLFISNLKRLVAVIADYRLPTIYNFSEFATAGGLLCYGANQNEAYKQAGVYAGRILKGEKPSELPVMQSTRLKFIVNLKTAKAFGINLSPTLLATADEVIE
jgi:putative tryptophan/tyrosine transport system substrate-binding protein